MGMMDAFNAEDRTNMKVSTLYEMLREAAKCELLMNAVNCDVPHRHIREMATGKRERNGNWIRERNGNWIPVEERTPGVDKEGYSERVLLSFENGKCLRIGEYRADEEGGAFFDSDDPEEQSLSQLGLFANAWMPLPKPYRAESEDKE